LQQKLVFPRIERGIDLGDRAALIFGGRKALTRLD
jgi:hypothetical protein